jgi:arylsulfatase A-like enzyme
MDRLGNTVLPGEGPLPKKLAGRVIDQYHTSIANLDKGIGAVLDKLAEMDLYDRTTIILVLDHGECFGEHRLVGHSKEVYQPALDSALIVKQSGQQEGRVDDTLVSTTDIPHVALSGMAGKRWKKYRSLFPDAPGNHPIISENYYARPKDLYNETWGHRFDRIRTALYAWPYKYIDSSDGRHELYHLEQDPSESTDLISNEKKIASKMAEALSAFKARRKEAGRFSEGGDSFVKPDQELLEELRTLGYIKLYQPMHAFT